MKNNNFNFWTPLDIKKGKDASGKKVMILGGIASTIDKDSDGENIDPSGFDMGDFSNIGFVNWHHGAKDKPATVIGEPSKVELRPEGFYVESQLYPSSQMARDVYELAETLERDSPTRKLGYSIEGTVIERGSEDEDHPDYNIVKKAKITGLAITHMPKNPKTFAQIIKGFVGGEMNSDSEGEEEEGAGLSTKKGKALVKESVDSKLKVLQKSYKIINLDENTIFDKIFDTFPNINIEKAKSIFSILTKIDEGMKNNKISSSQIEKAMDALGLDTSDDNPFLEKAEGETVSGKKVTMSPAEVANKVQAAEEGGDANGDEEAGEEDALEKGTDSKPIGTIGSNDLGSNKAMFKLISQKIEKGQTDNFNQNKALATLVKAQLEQGASLIDENVSLKEVIVEQNRIIKGLTENLSNFATQPQPRKSMQRATQFSEKESFAKSQQAEQINQQGTNVLSMSKNYNQVLNLIDSASMEKGYDADFGKATMSFEASKVLPNHIIERIKTEKGITIIE